ncbi:MAG TPA: MFS transporter [Longilinea sp.]|nr:MFS transporter [Longilinea sp.]
MTTIPRRYILALACTLFFSLGLMTAALGPLLPTLADQTGVDLAAVGVVFTGIFFGALAAQIVSGPLGDRWGQVWVVLIGAGLIMVGTLLISFSTTLPLLLAMAVLAGFGHGSVDLGGNVWIAQLFNHRSVSAVNLLNFFFGLGATSGAAVAGLAMRWWGTGLPALWLSSALDALAILGLILARGLFKNPPERMASAATVTKNLIYTTPVVWAFGLLILIYVGIENGVGGWTTTFMQQASDVQAAQAALITSGFWLMLTAGRMVSATLGMRLAAHRILIATLIGTSLAGGLLILGHGNLILSTVAILLMGFCFGPVYPTMIAITTSVFPKDAGKAAGVVASMGSVGGMVLPWLLGIVLAKLGISAFTFFALTANLCMAGLALSLYKRIKIP